MPDTSSFTNEGGAAANNIAAAVLAGYEMAEPHPIGDDRRFFTQVVADDANLEVVDTIALEAEFVDKYGANPRRKKGTVHVQDAESFIRYIEKHGLPETEVYADLSRMALVGILNAHAEAYDDKEQAAGHGDHRVRLELVHTDAWKAWTGLDKQHLSQQQFAEHIEDRAVDVIAPDSATMLEIAQSLIANIGVDFKSANRLADGQVQFQYEETATARAGHRGELDIPQSFVLGISPFEGCPPVEVVARFRYRVGQGGLKLFYALLNADDIARAAFVDYVDTVAESIDQPLFKGRPE